MKFIPLLFLAEALLLQLLGGVYANGFGGHPDEAAHFVSSVMVHDFLGHLTAGQPLAFARQFYLHYPKVAIGNWPPLLHVLLALWFLVFGVSRAAALGLIATCAAATATLMTFAGRRLLSPAAGVFAGAVYLALPLVQESTAVVMTEHLVTLLILASTLAFARFARTRATRDALMFGGLASAAILTRGSAWALAVVPPLVVVLTRDWSLLTDWRLWFAALMVGAVCVPWYVGTRGMSPNAMVGIDPRAPAAFFMQALGFFPLAALRAVGGMLALLAGAGVWRALLTRAAGPIPSPSPSPSPSRSPRPQEWPALIAMVIGVLLIQCIVPAGIENRYMLQLLPAVVLFAAAGLEWLLLARTTAAATATAAVVAFASLLTTFRLPDNIRNGGYERIASDLATLNLSDPAPAMLLISDARGEGSLIAAVALRDDDRRPHTVALRGSKVLVNEDWLGRASRSRFSTDQSVLAMLDAIPVNTLVIDHSIEPQQARPYHRQIEQLLKANSQDWQLHASYDITRYGQRQPRAVDVYLRRPHNHRNPQHINLAYVGQLMQRN